MSGAYRLAPQAQRDIEDLVEFIARDDFDAALRVEQELFDAFDLLTENPLIGHTRVDLGLPTHLRIWPFYSYLIVYRATTSPMEVVRIWHAARDKPGLL
jgi:plasmid stabilization system protein ParE